MCSGRLIVLLVAVSFCCCNPVSFGVVNDVRTTETLDWWQNAVFYQIYPRSFKDSDGDGVGDLQGIISKLPYLKESGITATWLSPIFSSQQVDQGYDIDNYREIDKLFGNMTDFEELVEEAKKVGIKLILDFVPNHTSDKHEWFIKSENNEAGFEDFYIWVDGKKGTPPNNWISDFGGSAWEWSEKRQQYYFHQFAKQQPDLNYNSKNVVKEMKDILKFWLEKGVDGFRMDAVPYLFEVSDLRDAPLARGYTECKDISICQDKTLITKDLDKTYDMIYQFREYIDNYAETKKENETKVIMTEAYTTIDNTMLYYQSVDGTRKGAHFTFNFNLITSLNKGFTLDDISDAINKWLVYLPKGVTSNWVLGNHDNHRVASRLGEENVDGFNMLIAFLPGIMVTYNGEEIGMLDGEVTCEEGADPAAIKDCSTFNKTSRDFERTPFQWDDSMFAGFSEPKDNKTWLPVGSSKSYINLEAQDKKGLNSHFNVYKQLTQLRNKFNTVATVDYLAVIKVSDTILQIVRQRDEIEYVYLFNIGEKDEVVEFYKKSSRYMVLVASSNNPRKEMEMLPNKVTLKSHESLIIHGMKGLGSRAQSYALSITLVVLLNILSNFL